jgi:hypothetical protein
LLAGIGTIGGPVVAAPAGKIGAGDAGAVGTLTVNNTLTVQGTASLRIDKTGGTPVSDLITGVSTMTYGGTLSVTNITSDATPLAAGDTFTLFTASSYTGAFVVTNLPALPGGLGWSNSLAANGSLTVVVAATVNTTPTNLVAVVNGGNLELSWPADHTGWRLQAQTNTLATGFNTNWVDVAGSATVNAVTNVINPAKGSVFYRMVYP